MHVTDSSEAPSSTTLSTTAGTVRVGEFYYLRKLIFFKERNTLISFKERNRSLSDTVRLAPHIPCIIRNATMKAPPGMLVVTQRFFLQPDPNLQGSTSHIDVVEAQNIENRKWIHKRPKGDRKELQSREKPDPTTLKQLEEEVKVAGVVIPHPNVLLPDGLVYVYDEGLPGEHEYPVSLACHHKKQRTVASVTFRESWPDVQHP